MFLRVKFWKEASLMPKKNPNPSALEAARHSAGLTRKALSEKTGIPLRTIEAYEQGKNDINIWECKPDVLVA